MAHPTRASLATGLPKALRMPEWQIGIIEIMCRNIRPLFNFNPPVTVEEIRDASLQFVRKISGFSKPSKANEAAFLAAVEDITGVSMRLLGSLETSAPAKNRQEETAKARAKAARKKAKAKAKKAHGSPTDG